MKKFFKVIGIGLVSILSLLALILIFVSIKGIPEYPVELPEYQAEIKPHSIERGRVLVSMLCAGCHMNKETMVLTGGKMMDAPSEFGEIFSANITQDPAYGIGAWTDAEIIYLLRTGIKRDGTYAPPYMAKLPNMADDDLNSIITFLRSDNPMVTSQNVPDKECEPSLLTKILCQGVFLPFEYPKEPIAMPDENNSVELGEYLVVNMECFSCHSADFKTNDFLTPEKSVGYLAGGNKPLNLDGQVMPTANLTPDSETGIGDWSKERFIKAVRFGQMEDEHGLQYPMQPYTHLSDKEVGAIYDYLRTVPAVTNSVVRGPLK